ncbi:MAG: Gfo/Idh/MocA family oxidoreductase [Candidatus Hydrogenedentes bacterium]|nr:Gfo/Idh/MocA family oxidoreductase [Candidatus Hydrogenedentota bacterium]
MKKNHLTRRQFLGKSAAIGAAFAAPAIIPSSALGLGGSTAPSERITMGVIGSGLQGTSNMTGFLAFKDVQMIAIADVDKAHREAAAAIVNRKYGNSDCALYNDFRELNDRDDIDAVIIATPDHWHALNALDAVRKGKDAYVQKPLAWSVQEGRALADAVKQHGRILQTGSQQRSEGGFRRACELVRNGRIGALKYVNIGIPGNNRECGPTWTPEPVPEGFDYDFWLGPAPWAEYHHQRCHYEFRFILDYSGGQVTNFGAHNLDIAQWGLGMDDSGPVEVYGNGVFPESGLFTTATKTYFECRYANGVELVCKTGKFGMTFEGTEGTIYVDRKTIKAWPEEILKEKIGKDEVQLYKSDDHYRNFADCVKSRQDPICTAEIGHRSATVCNIGNIAMRLGRRLAWDPVAERFPNDEDANALLGRDMRGEWAL